MSLCRSRSASNSASGGPPPSRLGLMLLADLETGVIDLDACVEPGLVGVLFGVTLVALFDDVLARFASGT